MSFPWALVLVCAVPAAILVIVYLVAATEKKSDLHQEEEPTRLPNYHDQPKHV